MNVAMSVHETKHRLLASRASRRSHATLCCSMKYKVTVVERKGWRVRARARAVCKYVHVKGCRGG
jgi:hypothetical protein